MKTTDHKTWLLTAQEMRTADSNTSEITGIPSLVLMERAALSMAEEITADFPDTKTRIAVIAGKGNNGADGIALARILRERGYAPDVFVMGEPGEGSSLALQVRIYENLGYEICPLSDFLSGKHADTPYEAAVDALFGTGLSRDLQGDALSAVQKINSLGAFVYSADIPSGLSCDTGAPLGDAVRADKTVTFGFYKRGQFLYPGPSFCGKTVLKEIGITQESSRIASFSAFTYRNVDPLSLLPPRNPAGNKGTFGKVLIAAGRENIAGCAVLSAKGCQRAGAGMVKVFTEKANRVILQEAFPGGLLGTWDPQDGTEGAVSAISSCLDWCDVCAAGPGLGRDDAAAGILRTILEAAAQGDLSGAVIDADAIRMIADSAELEDLLVRAGSRTPIILTPHMGECMALLHVSMTELRENRESLLHSFADSHHVTILCKDARSMTASAGNREVYINTSGNDGLSSAGSGDVLCGITAGFLAQGMPAFEAACAASYIHGKAAEILTGKKHTRSMTAEDLPEALKELL